RQSGSLDTPRREAYIYGVKNLKLLIPDSPEIEVRGNTDCLIGGIAWDSRHVRKGDLFFALPGLHTDGQKYIPDAVERGAAGIVHTEEFSGTAGVSIKTADPVRLMSEVSAAFWNYPSRRIPVIGVTGTDGKSSTVYYLSQLLESAGVPTGFITTALIKTAETEEKNSYRQTTLEAPLVHRLLDEMIGNGKKCAVIEASSHGLSLRTGRLRNVEFTGGILTNLTHEHLEFHGTFENYRHDKANLFRQVRREGLDYKKPFSVINMGSSDFDYFRSASAVPAHSYGLERPEADFTALDLQPDIRGTSFRLSAPETDKPVLTRFYLPGLFNVENYLAAMAGASLITGYPAEQFLPAAARLRSMPGRMTMVGKDLPFTVIVDYAHSPASFQKIFGMIKPYTQGRLIAVFGSAGERDREKRPLQGEIASDFCDLLVLTDEDPREEDSMTIIDEIAAGCRGSAEVKKIPDRKQAVGFGISSAGKGDTVLLLGKGHESSIIYADGPAEWDEVKAAESALAEAGYRVSR
ncbi:MAG: UDP-N-acetylmuramoyl-L-alanyl-D-glutamate--2,6-diaminopimelate ligase, partial [Spirochaetia bacterium]